jgi:mono/diheme cytochrome c family protein
MKIERIKSFVVIIFALAMLAGITFRQTPATVTATETLIATADDAAATYKTKCAMCHGPDASKKFDVTKDDEHHVTAILKGQKGEKPPHMPEYESKGINEEAAKALVAHMRSLRPAGN